MLQGHFKWNHQNGFGNSAPLWFRNTVYSFLSLKNGRTFENVNILKKASDKKLYPFGLRNGEKLQGNQVSLRNFKEEKGQA